MANFFFTREWLAYERLAATTSTPRVDESQSRLCLLAAGQVSFTPASTTASFIAAECTIAGYSRQPVGLACSGVNSNELLVSGHEAIAGQPVVFTSPSAPIVAGTLYYVVSPTTTGFKVSATPGGTAIAINSTGSMRAMLAPVYNGSKMRHVLTYQTMTAATVDIAFRGCFILCKLGGVDIVQGYGIYDGDQICQAGTSAIIQVAPEY